MDITVYPCRFSGKQDGSSHNLAHKCCKQAGIHSKSQKVTANTASLKKKAYDFRNIERGKWHPKEPLCKSSPQI